MTAATLEILQAGPHVTIQDAGRPGLMRFGVPASGPMDRKALMIANVALGNPPGTPGIEVSPGGLTLICRGGPLGVAIAGGGFVVQRNGERLGSWQRLNLQDGDRLTVRSGPWGNWCCLAVSGRIQSRTWLDSAATHALSGLGGGVLVAGARVEVDAVRQVREGAIPCPVWARPRQRIAVTLGPQHASFARDTLDAFLSSPFRMTASFDRMGLRLQGPALRPDGALGIPSEGIMRGAVQVAGDGVATVLMADHQTTGGYPKIATLLSDDTDGIAQLRPGDPLAFHALTPAEAVARARHRAAIVRAYLARLAAGA